MGISRVFLRIFSIEAVWNPSISGIWMSRMIKSMSGSRTAMSIASLPELASSTVTSMCFWMSVRSANRLFALSSTMRTLNPA